MRRSIVVAVHCLVYLFGGGLAIAEEQEILSWYTSEETQAELASGVSEWKRRAAQDGLAAAVDALQADVEERRFQLDPGSAKLAALDTFLALIADARRDSGAQAQAAAAAGTCKKPLDVPSATADLGSVVADSVSLPYPECAGLFRNPFSVTTMSTAAGVTVSDGVLDFPMGDTSEVSKQLVRYGTYIGALLADANLSRMQATSASIHLARTRWDAFMTNVVHDQFVWETLANGWLGESVDAFGGTLSQPPNVQLRIAHPLPVLLYSDEGGTRLQPRIGAEVLGWRVHNPDKAYEPAWGLSAIALLPGSADEKTGWGVNYTRKRLSIGVAWRTDNGEDDVFTVVFGVKFSDVFTNDATGFGDAVEEKLNDVLLQVENQLLP